MVQAKVMMPGKVISGTMNGCVNPVMGTALKTQMNIHWKNYIQNKNIFNL